MRLQTMIFAAVVLGSLGLVSIGCKQGGQPLSKEEAHLSQLARLYGQYLAENQGKPPPDAKTFKAFLTRLKNSGQLQLEDIEEVFVSPRDHLPYVIRYNVSMATADTGDGPVVAYEQNGLEGKHFVAFANTKVVEVSKQELDRMLGASGK
ncbi:MAG: hypothetical protein KatS3mg105_1933 [Gemmatales bacterium]|nr:MAG: hypothetical protein KatS3mg105_1933 [Gemmatales bacterium]